MTQISMINSISKIPTLYARVTGNPARVLLCLIFSLLLLAPMGSGMAQEVSSSADTNSSQQPATDPAAAELSTEQLRQGLIELLEHSGQSSSDVPSEQSAPVKWEQSSVSTFGDQIADLVARSPHYAAQVATAFGRTTNPEIGWSGWRIILTLAGIIIVGLLLERITTRKLLRRLHDYVDHQEKTTSLKYRFSLAQIVIRLIGLVVLGLVTFGSSLFFTDDNQYRNFLVTEFLTALIQFRLWLILLSSVFSPKRSGLRPIPVDDTLANQLYTWFTVFFAIIEFGGMTLIYLEGVVGDQSLSNGFLLPYTLALNLIVIGLIFVNRTEITAMFVSDRSENSDNQSFARGFIVQSWPFLVTAWLLLLWMVWLYNAFLGESDDARYAGISWWITLAFPVVDRMFHGLVKNVANIKWLDSPPFKTRSKRFIRFSQFGFRLVLASMALFALTEAGGFRAGRMLGNALSQTFMGHVVDLLFIAAITYFLWELLHAIVERRLPKEVDAIASLEGDGGGAGATRVETLLPLMSSIVNVVLLTFLVLSSLSSLGIAIGPIIAGAGVIGIAIGFGAQKLVQDVLSGVFFLIDDAFRKGEYIQLESLKGTVEKISLRSMQLRHHLGAVQTVPYGEIRTVKNLSRDWVTMKLELRLDYETDIEQVRKIIKKVGQGMLADEEMGPSFILPLKSQGVMRVEESALIVRMKFTTKPGEQWVIRREAYRRVRDALSAAGIHFATREVRVRLPGDEGYPVPGNTPQPPAADSPSSASSEGEEADRNKLLAEATAAAVVSVVAAEALKQEKIDEDGGGDDDR